ncbi:MAG: hypothetical protein M1840_005561 [Geoglossum simile]|nr:MAG: hypothetical protein M1840_005561 [Geoglossum simile]
MSITTVIVFTLCQLLLSSHSAWSSPINTTSLRTTIAPSWVATPQGRGTWDLLYSCTFTLTLCIWSAIHLNVPPAEKRRSFWLRKMKWVALALFMPELVLFSAWEQRHSAATLVDEFPDAAMEGIAALAKGNSDGEAKDGADKAQSEGDGGKGKSEEEGDKVKGDGKVDEAKGKGEGDEVKGGETENGETHKGIPREEIIEIGDGKPKPAGGGVEVTEVGDVTSESGNGKPGTQVAQNPPTLNIVQAFYVVMGGITLDIPGGRRTLTPRGLLLLAREGHFIDIPEDTIRDKSKADILAKGLVCCQVTWVVIQCIARKAHGLPVTLLEVHTMVHVVCALSMYALWFRKPLDVKYPSIDGSLSFRWGDRTLSYVKKDGTVTVLLQEDRSLPEDPHTLGAWDNCIFWDRSQNVFLWPEGHIGFGEMGKSTGWGFPLVQLRLLLVVAMLSAAYGGVHAAAWKFLFPSPAELLLWKISCVLCIAGSIPASIAVMAFADAWSASFLQPLKRLEALWQDWGSGNPVGALFLIIFGISLPVFVVARLYMVIEAFLSLRHTTTGSYATVVWAQYIPHF